MGGVKKRPKIRDGYSKSWRDIIAEERAREIEGRQTVELSYDRRMRSWTASRFTGLSGDVLTGVIVILIATPIALAFRPELQSGHRWLAAAIAAAWRWAA